MTLTTKIALTIACSVAASPDLGSITQKLSAGLSTLLSDGNAANQANKVFADTRTLGASASEDLDLNGVLLDNFGVLINFTKIRALIFVASAANVNTLDIGGAASNGFISPFGAATDKIKVRPGGAFALVAPDVNGYGVTAATADLLHVTNGGAGSGVTYDVIIVGS